MGVKWRLNDANCVVWWRTPTQLFQVKSLFYLWPLTLHYSHTHGRPRKDQRSSKTKTALACFQKKLMCTLYRDESDLAKKTYNEFESTKELLLFRRFPPAARWVSRHPLETRSANKRPWHVMGIDESLARQLMYSKSKTGIAVFSRVSAF